MTIVRVEIETLRGIREGSVDGLSPLSILVGPNNSGKSTVLESICCALAWDAAGLYGILLRRGGPALHALRSVMHRDALHAVVRVYGSGDRRSTTTLEIPRVRDVTRAREAGEQGLVEPFLAARLSWEFSKNGVLNQGASLTHVDRARKMANPYLERGTPSAPWEGSFVDVEAVRAPGALEDAYSSLERARRVAPVVGALKRSMPTLTDLRILKVDEDFILHTLHGDDRVVPAYLAGDGFKRFLEVASSVYAAGDGGVVLLEEPESFQHPRYLTEMAIVLRDAVARGTQVVLSTHSAELIGLLLEGADTGGAFPTVHRLRLVDGVLHAATVSAEDARFATNELMEDLRA